MPNCRAEGSGTMRGRSPLHGTAANRFHQKPVRHHPRAVSINFLAFSYLVGNPTGQVLVFFILTVAAAESAIGLAILVVVSRNLGTTWSTLIP
jgi:hypothetical protein